MKNDKTEKSKMYDEKEKETQEFVDDELIGSGEVETDAAAGDDDEVVEDLLILNDEKRQAVFDEGEELKSKLSDVTAKKITGIYGKYILLTFTFPVKVPHSEEMLNVRYVVSSSNKPESRFYSFYQRLTGEEPKNGVDLKSLIGTKVWVTIGHNTDDEGNVWDNVVAVRARKKKKK